MLAQSRRRWANIKSTVVQCLVFAEIVHGLKKTLGHCCYTKPSAVGLTVHFSSRQLRHFDITWNIACDVGSLSGQCLWCWASTAAVFIFVPAQWPEAVTITVTTSLTPWPLVTVTVIRVTVSVSVSVGVSWPEPWTTTQTRPPEPQTRKSIVTKWSGNKCIHLYHAVVQS